jgi:hypothetical protein
MFDAILLGLIVFAVGYTLAMRVMARKADVLHGEFIHSEEREPQRQLFLGSPASSATAVKS